jgi:gluconokinase
VLACSGLKERYRQQLFFEDEPVQLVYLKGDYELIRSRLSARAGHFMQPGLLRSQFEALEEPNNALVVDIRLAVEEIVDTLLDDIGRF